MRPVGKFILLLLWLMIIMVPTLSAAAETDKDKLLKVGYEGGNLSVNAVNAEAVELLRKIAAEAEFKLVASGFPQGFKVDVSFNNLPLEKGIDRVIRTLRKDASVSHVTVYERKGGQDMLYSLRVTYSGGPRQRSAPALPAPAGKVAKRPPPKPKVKKKPVRKKVEREMNEEEFQKWMDRDFVRELMDNLREEGWSEEDIMEHLRSLRMRR
jgi:hypothetical protein